MVTNYSFRRCVTVSRFTCRSSRARIQQPFPHPLQQKAALENTLADTEGRYSAMLTGFQTTINMLETELANVRSSIEQQGQEYRMLLDIKTRLEQEIATYRSLLETEESR